jgi:hypothetical protein
VNEFYMEIRRRSNFFDTSEASSQVPFSLHEIFMLTGGSVLQRRKVNKHCFKGMLNYVGLLIYALTNNVAEIVK